MRAVRRGDFTRDEMKNERKGRGEKGMKEGRDEELREKKREESEYVCTFRA